MNGALPIHWKVCILLFIPGYALSLSTKQPVDTAIVKKWIDTAWKIQFDDPQRSMKLALRALAESDDVYYFGMLNGKQLLGEGYYSAGQLDSAIFFYLQALHLSLAKEDDKESGNNYTSLATIYADRGDRDSSLQYFQKAILLFEGLKDSSSLADVLLRRGNVYSDIGNDDQAMEAFMHSLRISEAIHRDEYIAHNFISIGVVNDKQGNYTTAEEYFLKAQAIFKKQNDWFGEMSIYNNLGILYKNTGHRQKSMEAYQQSLEIADSTNFGRGQLSANTNLGILNVQMGFYENGLQHSSLALQLAREFEDKEAISDNLNWIARAQLGLKDYLHSEQNATEALRLGREVQSLEKQRDANRTLSDIFEAQRDFEQSLHYYKSFVEVKDSLYNVDKAKQIAELQTIYETEKKDKAIQLLDKNAEIDLIRRTRLWVALSLSLIAGALLVYSQWIRRTRDRKILSQEKELEVQRRQVAERDAVQVSRELDFKKQELAAKALLLARKNEFLQSINQEVDKMREFTEGRARESVRRISRQIHMDIESEEDWEQFIASFREVHHDFVDQLQQTYPAISRSELRLACLMKMNLSAKELAALLNITSDGVKKARHRLRKKMELDSAVDIQEYLLTFPS